jgi:hypothetical protein
MLASGESLHRNGRNREAYWGGRDQSPECSDEGAPRDDEYRREEGMTIDPIALAEQQRSEEHRPQRPRRVEGRYDAHSSAVQRPEQRPIAECQSETRWSECRDGLPEGGARAFPAGERLVGKEDRRCGDKRRRRSEDGRGICVQRPPSDDVVASGEENGAKKRKYGSLNADPRGASRLAGDRDAAENDQPRADEERRSELFVEQQRSKKDRYQGSCPHEDRSPWRSDMTHRERQEDLRGARGDQARGNERPEFSSIDAASRRERRRHENRSDGADEPGDKRPHPRVHSPPEAPLHRDREGAEGRARERRKQDRRHG